MISLYVHLKKFVFCYLLKSSFQMNQHNSIIQAFVTTVCSDAKHQLCQWCEMLLVLLNSPLPLPWNKNKVFSHYFLNHRSIYNKLFVQKVHLIVAEPLSKCKSQISAILNNLTPRYALTKHSINIFENQLFLFRALVHTKLTAFKHKYRIILRYRRR